MSFADKETFRGKRLLIIDDDFYGLKDFSAEMRARGFEVIPWLIGDKNKILKLSADCFPQGYRQEYIEEEQEMLREEHQGIDIIALPELQERLKSTAFDALLTDFELHPHRPFEADFTGVNVIREVAALKPGLPMVLHSGKYKAERGYSGADKAASMLAGDDQKVRETGGAGAFEKYAYDKITEAFTTAFTNRSKRI